MTIKSAVRKTWHNKSLAVCPWLTDWLIGVTPLFKYWFQVMLKVELRLKSFSRSCCSCRPSNRDTVVDSNVYLWGYVHTSVSQIRTDFGVAMEATYAWVTPHAGDAASQHEGAINHLALQTISLSGSTSGHFLSARPRWLLTALLHTDVITRFIIYLVYLYLLIHLFIYCNINKCIYCHIIYVIL